MTRNSSHVVKALVGGAAVVGVLAGCSATTSPAGGPPGPPSAASPTSQITESNPPGDIPDDQAFVAYTAADKSYTVKYPEGWARTDSGATVVFSDKYNSMTVAPHDGFYQPTEDYARTVEIPEIAATTAGFTPGQVSTVTRPAGSVVLITYQGDSAASPVTGKSVKQDVQRYEYARDGRGVVVTLAAPAGSDSVDPWRTITDSFSWQ